MLAEEIPTSICFDGGRVLLVLEISVEEETSLFSSVLSATSEVLFKKSTLPFCTRPEGLDWMLGVTAPPAVTLNLLSQRECAVVAALPPAPLSSRRKSFPTLRFGEAKREQHPEMLILSLGGVQG